MVNVTDDSKVSCLLCPAIIPRGRKETKNYNTTNMWCHLETKHEDKFATLTAKEKELEREKDKTTSVGSSSLQSMCMKCGMYFALFIKVLH